MRRGLPFGIRRRTHRAKGVRSAGTALGTASGGGDVGGSSPPSPEPGPAWALDPFSGVVKYRSWAAGESGLRRAKRAVNRQKWRWESSLSHRHFCLFPCPGACKFSCPTWRRLSGFQLLPIRQSGCKGRAPCRRVQGPRRPLPRSFKKLFPVPAPADGRRWIAACVRRRNRRIRGRRT